VAGIVDVGAMSLCDGVTMEVRIEGKKSDDVAMPLTGTGRGSCHHSGWINARENVNMGAELSHDHIVLSYLGRLLQCLARAKKRIVRFPRVWLNFQRIISYHIKDQGPAPLGQDGSPRPFVLPACHPATGITSTGGQR
jgi:hypothetical protein